jgi:hypothetical protein
LFPLLYHLFSKNNPDAGKNVAIADLPSIFGEGQTVIAGESIMYALWRGFYWSTLSDMRTKVNTVLQWGLTSVCGRDTTRRSPLPNDTPPEFNRVDAMSSTK